MNPLVDHILPVPVPVPAPFSPPPGTVINHMASDGRQYVGSPSLARLPDGALVASHDLFGTATREFACGVTLIFRSEDEGATWQPCARLEPSFWAGLFVHGEALYLLGTTHHHGLVAIRRSLDGGRTWTQPDCPETGLLTASGEFHTAPMPVVAHAGRLWRALEDAGASPHWGERYNPLLMSAPLEADLLRAESWTFTQMARQDRQWLEGQFGGWLEGNFVVLPDGRIGDLLRVDYAPGGIAALTTLSADGTTLEFFPESGFIRLPGAATKFTVRQDPAGPGYWTLVNAVPPQHAAERPKQTQIRNTLMLFYSRDLRHWEPHQVLLYHPDVHTHGFQYVDWLFHGDDLLAVSRTAWEDDRGSAPNEHDANYLTFHRFPAFRQMRLG
jgi:hypothetical protein